MWTWPLQDGLGSVRSVTSDTLAVNGTQHYAAYGTLIGAQSSLGTPFGFTGEQTEANGLVYLRARHYAPSLGIFPSLDPFEGDPGRPMSLNGYSYVEGNTLNRRDLSGKFVSLPYFGNSLDMARSLNNSLCLQTPIDLEPVIVFLGGSYSDANQYSSNPYRNPSCGPATIGDPGPSPFSQTKKWLERISSISDYVGDQWSAVGCGQEDYTVHTSDTTLLGVNLHGILVVRYMGSKLGQATIASAYTSIKFPDTVHGDRKRPVIVIGYSAGADSALFFARDYRSVFNIVDVVSLGPTFSGSHPDIVNPLEWGYDVVNVFRDILSSGININIVDDSGITDDFPDFEGYVEVLQDAYGPRATLTHTQVLGNPAYSITEHFDEDEQGDGTNNNILFIEQTYRQLGILN